MTLGDLSSADPYSHDSVNVKREIETIGEDTRCPREMTSSLNLIVCLSGLRSCQRRDFCTS
jgi:hypothetical protein